jgi:hypothetical protein
MPSRWQCAAPGSVVVGAGLAACGVCRSVSASFGVVCLVAP